MRIQSGLVLIAVSVSLSAQVGPAVNSAGESPAQSTSTLRGLVRDAVSGLPLANMRITAKGPSSVPSVQTDTQGRYEFIAIPPGSWIFLTAQQDAYIPKLQRLTILPGSSRQTLDFAVDRWAVLAGRILDSAREPVPNAMVSTRREGYRNGRRVLMSYHSIRSNDLGEFRLSKLLPGAYYVEVEPTPIKPKLKEEGGKTSGSIRRTENRDVRTYYPGLPSMLGAVPVTLHSGQQIESLDISLLKARTSCIDVEIIDHNSGSASRPVMVHVSELFPMSQARVAAGEVTPGNDYEICGVPDGSYRLWAFRFGGAGGTELASEMITVSEENAETVPLHLEPPQPMTGTLTLLATGPEDRLPAGVSVSLAQIDRISVMGESLVATVKPDGSFMIPGSMADDYWLQVGGVPPGYYLRQATAGNLDAAREPIRPGMGELKIVLASDGPSISGRVTNDRNEPVGNSCVILAANPFPAKVATNELLTATTDETGQFTFTGMAPGSFRLFAFTGLTEFEAADPEFVRAQSSGGTEISLGPREAKSVSVAASAAAPVRR